MVHALVALTALLSVWTGCGRAAQSTAALNVFSNRLPEFLGPAPRVFTQPVSMTIGGVEVMVVYGGLQSDVFDDMFYFFFLTNTWIRALFDISAPYPGPRYAYGAAPMNATHILYFGGLNGRQQTQSDLWTYNIATHVWTEILPIDTSGTWPTQGGTTRAAALFGGEIIYFTGMTLYPFVSFNTTSFTWGTVPHRPFGTLAYTRSCITTLGNDTILLVGSSAEAESNVYMYSPLLPADSAWYGFFDADLAVPFMTTVDGCSTMLPAGHLPDESGVDNIQGATVLVYSSSVYVSTIPAGAGNVIAITLQGLQLSWKFALVVTQAPTPLKATGYITDQTGSLILFGGAVSLGIENDVYRMTYSQKDNYVTWSDLDPSPPTPRPYGQLARIGSTDGYLFFGGASNFAVYNEAYVYNSTLNEWGLQLFYNISESAPQENNGNLATPIGRVAMALTSLRDEEATDVWSEGVRRLRGNMFAKYQGKELFGGTVLLFGGSVDTVDNYGSLSDTWLFLRSSEKNQVSLFGEWIQLDTGAETSHFDSVLTRDLSSIQEGGLSTNSLPLLPLLNATRSNDTLFHPTPRSSAAIASGSLYDAFLYGGSYPDGNSGHTILLNDSYYFELLMINDSLAGLWHRIEPADGVYPLKRTSHSLVRHNTFLVAWGGKTQNGNGPLDILTSVSVLDLEKVVWTEYDYPNAPSGRFSALAGSYGNKLFIYGGEGLYQFFNFLEINVLDMSAADPSRWWWSVLTVTSTPDTAVQCSTGMVGSGLAMYAAETNAHEVSFLVFGGKDQSSVRYNDMLSVKLACAAGSSAAQFAYEPCTQCVTGSYANTAGARNCSSCPGDAITTNDGAATSDACNVCRADECNHGTCSIAPETFTAVCACDFAYHPKDRCKTPWLAVITMSTLVAIALCAVIVMVILRLRRQHTQLSLDKEGLGSELQHWKQTWQIDENELSLEHRVDVGDEGAYGEVYLARWQDLRVAVKVLKNIWAEDAPDVIAEFERESALMATLRHTNVVRFYGTGVYGDSGRRFLVTEFMARGSLNKVLLSDESLEWGMRIRFALDCARGLKFLHRKQFLHRDIKSNNCLVSEQFVVKVSDFGSSKLYKDQHGLGALVEETEVELTASTEWKSRQGVKGRGGEGKKKKRMLRQMLTRKGRHSGDHGARGRSHGGDGDEGDADALLTPLVLDEALEPVAARPQETSGVGSLVFQAPEVISKTPVYTAKSDVYSFGVVLWEIYARDVPFSHLECEWDITDAILGGSRPVIDGRECPQGYLQLMQECWHPVAAKRPTFDTCVARLEVLQDTM